MHRYVCAGRSQPGVLTIGLKNRLWSSGGGVVVMTWASGHVRRAPSAVLCASMTVMFSCDHMLQHSTQNGRTLQVRLHEWMQHDRAMMKCSIAALSQLLLVSKSSTLSISNFYIASFCSTWATYIVSFAIMIVQSNQQLSGVQCLKGLHRFDV